MKILAASDIHGDKSALEKLVKKAKKEDVDMVVLCGDLTLFEEDLTGIIGPLKELNKKVILIPGNHETFSAVEFLAKQYKPGVYNLHGRSMKLYNEIGFFGVGGSNTGIFQTTEKETSELLEKAHKPIEDAKHKIMITHTPPHNTKIDALWEHVGSKAIREKIEEIQPDVVLCGHIHETFGKSEKIGNTTVINVGKDGVIIDIEK